MKKKAVSGCNLPRAHGFNIGVVACFLCLGVTPAALAYLDPGTFSFVIQTLIAALVGALFVLKSYWLSIKNWFAGKGGKEIQPVSSDRENDKSQADQRNDKP